MGKNSRFIKTLAGHQNRFGPKPNYFASLAEDLRRFIPLEPSNMCLIKPSLICSVWLLAGSVLAVQAQTGPNLLDVRSLDLNGDGRPDLLAGGDPEPGRAWFYPGEFGMFPSEPAQDVLGDQGPHWGTWGENIGDLNNDGYSDVAVGARYVDGYGTAYFYFDGPAGLLCRGNGFITLSRRWLQESACPQAASLGYSGIASALPAMSPGTVTRMW